MALIGLIICIIVALISWKIWNDFLTPPFILSFEWILMYLILILSVESEIIASIYYICFAIGLVSFFMGFLFVVSKGKEKYSKMNYKIQSITFNSKVFWFLFSIQFIVTIIIIIYLRKSLESFYVNNLWYSIKNAEKYGIYQPNVIIERLKIFVLAFPMVTFPVYILNNQKQNKRYFILTFLISIPVIFTMSRGGMIMIVIVLLFIFLNIKNYSNGRIIKWGAIGVVIILLIFSITSIWKFSNLVEYKNNNILLVKYAFKNYFVTSMINFVEWAKTPKEYLYGQNTFRFIFAILKSIGFNVNVTNTIQEFRNFNIGDTYLASNVYTILHYYASDFGIGFSFFIELLLGMFHGFLYKKANQKSKINLFYIIIFALMMYPLFNQFFADIYISTISSWLQYYFWIWLLTRRKFILVTDKKT